MYTRTKCSLHTKKTPHVQLQSILAIPYTHRFVYSILFPFEGETSAISKRNCINIFLFTLETNFGILITRGWSLHQIKWDTFFWKNIQINIILCFPLLIRSLRAFFLCVYYALPRKSLYFLQMLTTVWTQNSSAQESV